MKNPLVPIYLTILLLMPLFLQHVSAQSRKSIAASELEFAACARKEGIKCAFEKYMAPTGYLVAGNKIVNALTYYKDVTNDTTDLLWWKPTQVFVNQEDDFGFATGPFLYFKNKNGKPIAAGYTFSIWERGEDRVFRILFDGGVAVRDVLLVSMDELEQETFFQHVLETDPAAIAMSTPTIAIPKRELIHAQAIFLRTERKEICYSERTEETPSMIKQIQVEGFDRSGKTYYRFGNLGKNNEALASGKFCGYFAQVWLLRNSKWILVADVMQYS